MSTLNDRRAEFRKYVWNHSIDPFQTQFDDRRPLSGSEVTRLAKVGQIVRTHDDAPAATAIRPLLVADSELFALLLQLVGLTRNKILQDLKAAQRAGAINCAIPSSFERLPHTTAWKEAGPYLVTRL